MYIQVRDRGVSTCIAYLSTLPICMATIWPTNLETVMEKRHCTLGKLDWRPSERTDAGGAGENAYRCYRNAIPGV